MKISSLVSEHLDDVRRRYAIESSAPVVPKHSNVPVLATTRWQVVDGFLRKSFLFLRQEQRDQFVVALLGYEANVGHHASITLNAGGEAASFCVDVAAATSGGRMITELDKEYARNADAVYVETMRRSTQYIASNGHQD